MEKVTIKRDGLPPIAFTGSEIGSASNEIQAGNRANRWTKVTIYRTQGGRYIASVNRLTCWQGESDACEAKSLATASEVIAFLQNDQQELGSVSQEAVEEAATNDPAFAAAWVEVVE